MIVNNKTIVGGYKVSIQASIHHCTVAKETLINTSSGKTVDMIVHRGVRDFVNVTGLIPELSEHFDGQMYTLVPVELVNRVMTKLKDLRVKNVAVLYVEDGAAVEYIGVVRSSKVDPNVSPKMYWGEVIYISPCGTVSTEFTQKWLEVYESMSVYDEVHVVGRDYV